VQKAIGDGRVVTDFEPHLVVGLEVMDLLGLDRRFDEAVQMLEVVLRSAEVVLDYLLDGVLQLADAQIRVEVLYRPTTLYYLDGT